jgi:hypothetical protein
MNFIIAGLSIIYITICGFGLIKLLLKDNIPFSLFGLIPLCFGAGLGVLSILCNLIMLIGMRLSFFSVYAPLFILFVYAITQIKFRIKVDQAALLKTIKGISWMEWILIFVTVFGVLSILMMSVTFPVHFWDSRAIWATKAKMLFYSGTVNSSDFMDITRVHPHFRYPLLFPEAQNFLYLAMGQADDWAVMMLIGLFFPMMVSFLFDLTRIYLDDREKALIAASMLALLPVFFMSEGPAHSGFADTPLAMLYILSFGITLLWKRNRDFSFLIFSAFLSAILLLTKNEGINLVLLNMFLIALPEKISFNKERIIDLLKAMIVFLAIITLIYAPWLILTRNMAVDRDVNDIFQLIKAGKIDISLAKSASTMIFSIKTYLGLLKNQLNYGFMWGGLWLIFAVTAIISILKRSTVSVHLLLIVLLNYCAIIMGFVIIPITSEGFMQSNFYRLNFAISPVVVLQIIFTLKALESEKSKT